MQFHIEIYVERICD